LPIAPKFPAQAVRRAKDEARENMAEAITLIINYRMGLANRR
jgi:hypothetical protein